MVPDVGIINLLDDSIFFYYWTIVMVFLYNTLCITVCIGYIKFNINCDTNMHAPINNTVNAIS